MIPRLTEVFAIDESELTSEVCAVCRDPRSRPTYKFDVGTQMVDSTSICRACIEGVHDLYEELNQGVR